jgi:hypothetical protein
MLGIEEPPRILAGSLDSHPEVPNAGLTNRAERHSSEAFRLGGCDKI